MESQTIHENLLAGTQWQLSGYGNLGDLQPSSVESTPTLSFREGNLSGNTGCNRYNANYILDGDIISLERLFRTEMECLGPGLGQQETDYLDLLNAVETFTLNGESLILSGPEGVLIYQSVVSPTEKSLVRRLWRLETIVQIDDQEVVNTPVDARFLITAWFEDRRIGGWTGCNSYNTPYQKIGERLIVGDSEFEMTQAGCPDDESASLEGDFTRALQAAETFTIKGDRLTIATAHGQLVFVAQPETAADENAIYTAVLREWDGGVGSYVFSEQTRFNQPGISLDATLAFVQQQLPPASDGDPFAISPQVLNDFEQKNVSTSSLRKFLHIPFPAAFLTEAEKGVIFSAGEQAGWETFHERFPGSPGVFTFSRVGFNEGSDQAVVYMGIQTADFEGGYYFFLVKQDGLWSSAISFMIWG